MTIRDRMAWFLRQSSVPAIRERAESTAGGMVLREEEPRPYGTSKS